MSKVTAAALCRPYLPVGATVFITVTGFRRTRHGNTRTTMSLFSLSEDSYPVPLSGPIATLTGNIASQDDFTGQPRLTAVTGDGDPAADARQVVGALAIALHGSSTALRSHIL